MANNARDLRQQAQEKWCGSEVVERGRNYIVHQHPTDPRRKMIDTALGPLHIAGTETEIDTAWHPTDGVWQYGMNLADYHAYARSVLSEGDTVLYINPSADQSIAFRPYLLSWVNQDGMRQFIAAPQPVSAIVTDDTLRWENGYGDGRHFHWQTQTTRLQKVLTIDSAANLPEPTIEGTIWLDLRFTITLSGGAKPWIDGVAFDDVDGVAGHIEFRSTESGEVLWTLDRPHAWDSGSWDGTIGQFHLTKHGSGYHIAVRVPKSWIDSAVFPIYIDPTIDSTVGSGTNDGQWSGSSYSTTTTTPVLGLHSSGTTRETGQLFTGISGLFGSTIDVSYLSLYTNAILSGIGGLMRISAVDSASPSAPTNTTEWNAAKANQTTAYSADWRVPDADGYTNSPSLNSVIQELADSHDVTAICILALSSPNDTLNNATRCIHYDSNPAQAPALHIEYTEAGGPYDLTSTNIIMGPPVVGVAALDATTFVDGYGGDVNTATDVLMSAGWPTYNGGQHGDFDLDPINPQRVLLRFDASSIPGYATLYKVTLYLTRSYGSEGAGAAVGGVHLISTANLGWIEGIGNIEAALLGEPTWNAKESDGAGGVQTAWAGSAGLSTAGTDYETPALGTYAMDTDSAIGTVVPIELNPTSIKSRMTSNDGEIDLILVTTSGNNGHVGSSENSTTAYRPYLEIIYSGSPETADPTIANAASGHVVDTPTLTQAQIIGVDESTLGHIVDQAALSSAQLLTVDSTSHTHTTDVAAVDQQHTLSVGTTFHVESVDDVAVTQVQFIGGDAANHGHQSGAPALSQVQQLTLDDSISAHTADSVEVNTATQMEILSASSGHSVDEATLTQVQTLITTSAAHGHAVSTLAITQAHTITISDAASGHSADEVAIDTAAVLGVANASSAHTTDLVLLGQIQELSIADAVHAHLVPTLFFQRRLRGAFVQSFTPGAF